MPEELLDEARVGVPRDEATGGVTQRVEAQGPQAGGVTSCLEAATDGLGIEAPAKARAEDVVLA